MLASHFLYFKFVTVFIYLFKVILNVIFNSLFYFNKFFSLLYLIFRKNVCKVANFRVFKCRSTIFLKYKHFDFYHFVRWFSNIYIPQNVVSYSNFYFIQIHVFYITCNNYQFYLHIYQ